MMSGQSLFLFDQREGTGPGTALFYKKQSARLLRNSRGHALPAGFDNVALARAVEESVSPSAETFEGNSLVESCLHRADLMVSTLLRSLPPLPAGFVGTADSTSRSIPGPTPELAGTR
jgi:hypothetical protein